MVEETAPVTPVVASVAAPATAPIEAPVAPVTAAALIPAPTPEAAPVAPVEAPKAVTVMGEALDAKVEPVKPAEITPKPEPVAEVKPAVEPVKEEPKAQEGQSENPAPPPAYDPFTVPEGVTLDEERVTKFTDILRELETTGKADHAAVQQFGQKAVDFHVEEVQKAVENLQNSYMTAWEKQKTDWKDTFMKDPELGGNRFQTTVDAARNFIRTHGGSPEQQQEFRDVMESSGLGNHPAVIRLLANAGTAMKEGTPIIATKPVSAPKSKVSTLYGAKA